jgi:hypothetical protein
MGGLLEKATDLAIDLDKPPHSCIQVPSDTSQTSMVYRGATES